MDDAIKWLESQVQPICKIEPKVHCDYCLMSFDKAGTKFKHQRDVHGEMDGWSK